MSLLKNAILVLCVTALIGSSSQAQHLQLHWYISAGGAHATGDLDDPTGFGYVGRIGVGITLIEARSGGLDMVAYGQYSRFPSRIDTEGDFGFITPAIDLQLQFEQTNGSVLYLVLGGGYARLQKAAFTFRQSKLTASGQTIIEKQVGRYNENDFFVSPGIGAFIGRASGVRPFVEIRYTDISGAIIPDMQYVSMLFGVRF